MGGWSTRYKILWMALAALATVASTACIEAESRVCAWGGICPPGLQCHADTRSCVLPLHLTVCVGVNDGEGCPSGGLAGHYICRDELCQPSVCGDGLADTRTDVGEVCDDGNTVAGDGCRADCRGTEICGDGRLDDSVGEECDDNNGNDEDGCTRLCRFPTCGDGIRTGGEACDDGPLNSDTEPDACRQSCRKAGCGDQVIDSDERGRCWLLTGGAHHATGAGSADLAVGDLNGDALPDLVVVSGDASSLSVFLSDGPGGLVEADGSPYALTHPCTAAAIADLDSDGAADVVVVSAGGHMAWLSGDGAGGLNAPQSAQLNASFTDVVVADLAQDADPEILATDRQAGLLWVFGVDGAQAPELISTQTLGATGAQPTALVSADLNDDGRPEIAVANRAFAQVHLLTPDSAGVLQPVDGFPLPVGEHWSSTVGDILLGDANGDELPDLVWLDVRSWSSSYVGTLLGDGNLGFTPDASGLLEVGPDVIRFAGGDIDADGALDLLAPRVTATSAYLLLGGTAAPFALDPDGPVLLQASSRVIALSDFDGDGLVDLVLADQHAGYVDLYRNAP